MRSKIDHLKMIQGIINRLAGNSFMLKGWAVTLVAGIFALASKDSSKGYFLIAYVPIIVFWGLDSYYLLQERLYRALYDKIRQTNETEIDFNMNTADIHNTCYLWCLLSFSEFFFYVPLAALSAIVIIITN